MDGLITYFLILGVYHGINPGMGWLFSVAIAMQKESTIKIFTTHLPIALGHLLSLLIVVILYEAVKHFIPFHFTKIIFAILLVIFGIYKLYNKRHPNWTAMNVTHLDLFIWSFLMTSAHGAGLMLIPGLSLHAEHDMMAISKSGMFAMLFHMLGMITISITVAFSVYKIIGLRILRSAWINFDYIWSFVLIVAGIFVLFV
ncbi:MAG: hypothetical protein VYB18_01865 [Thermodesulfobacteriota bacterium]|nr:hypothetical protein [Thermodesulfobacteriota bacterium]